MDRTSTPEPSPSSPSPLRTVAVVGLGTMGTGIAEVLVRAGREVVGIDVSEAAAAHAVRALETATARAVRRERITEDERRAALARFRTATDLQAAAGADLVIEVVPEDYAVKHEVFTALDAIVRPETILATGTNALSVTRLAADSARPERVLGMHFFNPAPAMKLVEVVRTVLTADDVHATVRAVCAKVRKHAVDCGDRAGFIVNALLFPYLNNAVKMVQEHYASPDDIDAAMKLGGGYPMGPFELLDVVGLDVSLAIEKVLHREFRDPGLAPAPLLEHLVAAGCLGRKTGRGFREYAKA